MSNSNNNEKKEIKHSAPSLATYKRIERRSKLLVDIDAKSAYWGDLRGIEKFFAVRIDETYWTVGVKAKINDKTFQGTFGDFWDKSGRGNEKALKDSKVNRWLSPTTIDRATINAFVLASILCNETLTTGSDDIDIVIAKGYFAVGMKDTLVRALELERDMAAKEREDDLKFATDMDFRREWISGATDNLKKARKGINARIEANEVELKRIA